MDYVYTGNGNNQFMMDRIH